MRSAGWGLALAVAILVTPLARAQDQEKGKAAESGQSTPIEKLRDILKEYQKAQEAFSEAYSKAKTDEDRQKILDETYPQPEKYAERLLKLAEDHPKDTAALDALVWVATNAPFGPSGQKAVQALARDHLNSPKMAEVCARLVYMPGDEGPNLLRKLVANSPHEAVKAQATMALAQVLMERSRGNPALMKEAEALFEEVVAKYADVKAGRGTLGEMARAELHELRELAVGKVAPEVQGEDIDGRPMKLSDFRGKVVVLDFWGHW
jgi:hypothetical protein